MVSSQLLSGLFLQRGLTGTRFFFGSDASCILCTARMLSQAVHHAWQPCLNGTYERSLRYKTGLRVPKI